MALLPTMTAKRVCLCLHVHVRKRLRSAYVVSLSLKCPASCVYFQLLLEPFYLSSICQITMVPGYGFYFKGGPK